MNISFKLRIKKWRVCGGGNEDGARVEIVLNPRKKSFFSFPEKQQVHPPTEGTKMSRQGAESKEGIPETSPTADQLRELIDRAPDAMAVQRNGVFSLCQ